MQCNFKKELLMSDSILRAKQDILLKFFTHVSKDKQFLKVNDLDNFENIITNNNLFKEIEMEISDLLNDLTYYAIGKLDIRLNGIDETMINKIVCNIKIIYCFTPSIKITIF